MFSKFSKWNKKIDPSARRIYTVMVTDVFPIISHRLPVTFFLWLMPSISIRPANFFLHLPYSRKPLPTLFPDRTHKGIQTFRERETRQVDFSSRSWKKRKRKRRKKETKNSSSWIPRRGKEKREGRNDRGRNSDIFLRPESWSRDSLSLSLRLSVLTSWTREEGAEMTGIVRKIGSSGWPGALRFVPKLRRYICTAMNNQ